MYSQLTYNIVIDRDNCIACANCYTIDPLHFESDPEGKSKVIGGKSNGARAEQMAHAPHGKETLERIKLVGMLVS